MIAAIIVAFLVTLVFALRCDNDAGKLWLWNLKSPVSGFWLIDYQMRLQWGRIWLIGLILGLLIPAFRLTPWRCKRSPAG